MRLLAIALFVVSFVAWQIQAPIPAIASAGTPFSIIYVPDPQYLANDSTCGTPFASTIYSALIQWGITNKQLSVNGTPLNIKGFITVGDIVDVSQTGSNNAGMTAATNALALATAANMFVIPTPGNHDYAPDASITRSHVSFMLKTGGAFDVAALATLYGANGMDLGSGDRAFFGGAYGEPNGNVPVSAANTYWRLYIQGKRIIVTAAEFFPRTEVLNWARGIASSNPDHEWWFVTHAGPAQNGAHTLYTYTASNGPSSYGLSDAATCPGTCTNIATDPWGSNSPDEMWNGSAAGTIPWTGLKNDKSLTAWIGGHWIDGWNTGAGYKPYQQQDLTSLSSNTQAVHTVFTNGQGSTVQSLPNWTGNSGDLTDYCNAGAGPINHTIPTANLFILRFFPNTNQVEGMMLSTNIGSGSMWVSSAGVPSQASYGPLFTLNWPIPNSVHRIAPIPNSVQ